MKKLLIAIGCLLLTACSQGGVPKTHTGTGSSVHIKWLTQEEARKLNTGIAFAMPKDAPSDARHLYLTYQITISHPDGSRAVLECATGTGVVFCHNSDLRLRFVPADQ